MSLRLVTQAYHCKPCERERGLHITALVRMMTNVVILDGEPVGTECWACPVCHAPKYPLRKPRKR